MLAGNGGDLRSAAESCDNRRHGGRQDLSHSPLHPGPLQGELPQHNRSVNAKGASYKPERLASQIGEGLVVGFESQCTQCGPCGTSSCACTVHESVASVSLRFRSFQYGHVLVLVFCMRHGRVCKT